MWTVIETPIDDLRIVAHDGAITQIDFHPHDAWDGKRPVGERQDDAPLLVEARTQLAAYFARELKDFDLPLAPVGTDFQHQVWAELRRIAWGETATYGQVAHRLGRTNMASRAVGLANGRNPIPIVVPCHRVIGADGTLTGYAGGMGRKQVLLDLESDSLF
ncbi:methylated-DNA--[protein]-cysteine S-methyltransferase [Nocardioides alcanivorans]|uniref:methylated-DNA--[protein]-cysteine S-methyltransferase n=1 Tax=Nocardioides alcanivorans TaxID=2897352 RepID=UPI001F3A2F2C|nr:methylated-DNA--[protein]-cysteine S-methyltransferase [Nocardioides alcanivorans]